MDEFFPQMRDLVLKTAAQLPQGDRMCGFALRGDQVGHGLGLRKVHLAVEEGA